MERTLTLSGGRFLLTSFVNKAVSEPQEYVQGGASPEFRATVNGEAYSGATGGWKLDTWSTQQLPQGESALDIKLTNGVLAVTRHFVVYPGTAVVREWTTYENAGRQDVTVSDASFLDAVLMSEDLQDGPDASAILRVARPTTGHSVLSRRRWTATMPTPLPVRRRAIICHS